MLELAQKSGELASLYHRAFKKIQHVDPSSYEPVEVTSENGWKFELFLHDFFPLLPTDKFGLLECDRKTEFAPVKNANTEKEDTPQIACQMLLAECGSWLIYLPGNINNIEISPLVSYEGERDGDFMDEIEQHMQKFPGLYKHGGYVDQSGYKPKEESNP